MITIGKRFSEWNQVQDAGTEHETRIESFSRIIGGRTFDFFRGVQPNIGYRFIIVQRREAYGVIRHHFTSN